MNEFNPFRFLLLFLPLLFLSSLPSSCHRNPPSSSLSSLSSLPPQKVVTTASHVAATRHFVSGIPTEDCSLRPTLATELKFWMALRKNNDTIASLSIDFKYIYNLCHK